MFAVFCVSVLSLFNLSMTSPLEDDVRALKTELEVLKSKTDVLEHNYTSLQKTVQLYTDQNSGQLQQNLLALRQDLMFVQKEVNNLTDSSYKNMSLLQTVIHQNDIKAMNKLELLKNLTSESSITTENRLLNLEQRINQEHSTFILLQNEEEKLKTHLSSHFQDYAALKSAIKAVENEVHSTIAFKATAENVNPQADIIKFNQVPINIGNAYNSDTGRFTCPRNGLYRFTCVLNIRYERNKLHFRLNGNIIPNYSNSSTLSTLLELNKGDSIWIQTIRLSVWTQFQFTGSFRGYLISTK